MNRNPFVIWRRAAPVSEIDVPDHCLVVPGKGQEPFERLSFAQLKEDLDSQDPAPDGDKVSDDGCEPDSGQEESQNNDDNAVGLEQAAQVPDPACCVEHKFPVAHFSLQTGSSNCSLILGFAAHNSDKEFSKHQAFHCLGDRKKTKQETECEDSQHCAEKHCAALSKE